MSENRNTTHTLLVGIISVVLCCVMLLGTTYAWLNETITAGITVEAENLGVDLMDEAGHSLITQNNAEADSSKENAVDIAFYEVQRSESGTVLSAESATVWDLGKTYQTGSMTLKNTGSLAVKYTISVEGIEDVYKDAFTFSLLMKMNGENQEIRVMPFTGVLGIDAGNMEAAFAIQAQLNGDNAAAAAGASFENMVIKIMAEQQD